MNGIQLLFASGARSPLFETTNAYKYSLKSFEIDPTKEVRYVRMVIKYGIYYNGLEFFDENEESIVKEVWRSSGSWTEKQEIPPGQHIIGLKCDVATESASVNHFSFLLGEVGKTEVVGELRFPARQVYPTYQEF